MSLGARGKRGEAVAGALAGLAGAALVVACGAEDAEPEAGLSAPPLVTPGVGAPPASSLPSPDASPSGDAAAPDAASDAPAAPDLVVATETLDVAGASREYVLVAPRAAKRATSLVLALHGDGGDGASFRAALALEAWSGEDAVVVYPSGLHRSWDLYTPSASNADLAFLEALVAALRARCGIAPERVFATGFSSGAFMVNQVACRRPALLRAIASHGGGAPAEPEDPTATTWDGGFTRCAGQAAGVGALVVHGEDDGVVSWASGDYTARYWAAVDGCASARAPASGAFGAAGCVAATACPPATPVVLCAVPALAHALWPHAARVTWAFFAAK